MRKPLRDVNALPLWVQQMISTLSADVEYWRGIAHSCGADGDSRISLGDGLADPIKLPRNAIIRWDFPHEKWIEARLREDEGLDIRGLSTLWVRPNVSNDLVIYPSVWDHDLRDDRPVRSSDQNPLVDSVKEREK